MKPLALLYCILCVSLVSCTRWSEEPKPTQKVVYQNNWQQQWIAQNLERCKVESAVLTIQIYEAKGRTQSKEEVEAMGRMLLWSCYKFYKISV